MRVIEREGGHYEVREVPYGKVYGWCPRRVVFECDCGERHAYSGSAIVCACGAIYRAAPDSDRPTLFVVRQSSSTTAPISWRHIGSTERGMDGSAARPAHGADRARPRSAACVLRSSLRSGLMILVGGVVWLGWSHGM